MTQHITLSVMGKGASSPKLDSVIRLPDVKSEDWVTRDEAGQYCFVVISGQSQSFSRPTSPAELASYGRTRVVAKALTLQLSADLAMHRTYTDLARRFVSYLKAHHYRIGSTPIQRAAVGQRAEDTELTLHYVEPLRERRDWAIYRRILADLVLAKALGSDVRLPWHLIEDRLIGAGEAAGLQPPTKQVANVLSRYA